MSLLLLHGPTTSIGPVFSISYANVTATTVDVSWDPPTRSGSADIIGYDVEYQQLTSDAWVDSISPAATFGTVTGLTPETGYLVRVRARNGVDTPGPWTQSMAFTTTAAPAPGSRVWFDDNLPTYTTPTPTGSGVTRDVTSLSEFNSARAAAGPGDVIRITQVIQLTATTACVYDNADGTAANPIVITCAGNGEIRSVTSWTVNVQFPEGLSIRDVDHVHAIGCKVRDGQFTFRLIGSHGTAPAPIKVWHNTITGSRDANLYVGSAAGSNTTMAASRFCSHVSVKYNFVGNSPGTVEFNEGIYVGVGTLVSTWLDTTHDIEIAYNEIQFCQGDGVDIKLGAYNITIHHNKIHDCACEGGSGITTGATNPAIPDNPTPSFNANIIIHSNWIWNMGYDIPGPRGTGAPYGMYVTKPGTKCYNNVIWSMNGTTGIGINSTSYIGEGSQTIEIYNNTVYVQGTAFGAATYDGSATSLSRAYANNLSLDGSQSSTVVNQSLFVGPLPTTSGAAARANVTADAGNGPGSAFLPISGATSIVGQATGTIPTDDATGVSRPQGGASDRGAYELTA